MNADIIGALFVVPMSVQNAWRPLYLFNFEYNGIIKIF